MKGKIIGSTTIQQSNEFVTGTLRKGKAGWGLN